MKLAILSRAPRSYSTQRLRTAALDRGHRVKVLNTLRFGDRDRPRRRGAIIDYIDNQVAFPEIDVRQRLTVSTGYGVAEIAVFEGSDLVGKTLGDSGLRERDITALTLHRGVSVIPNPNSHHVLEANDRLLCFGKLEEMRSMIPSRRRRTRRVKKLPAEPIHDVPAEDAG